MPLNRKQLIDLPVWTQSGQHLGKVVDFELDGQTQQVVQYHVRSTDLISGLLAPELLVSREQVVSLTKEKMVVEDTLSPVKDAEKKPLPAN